MSAKRPKAKTPVSIEPSGLGYSASASLTAR